ncbi:MFS transporter [Variovorax sp. RT4R15]|uniref:MFS transporter n=1 Tax=Variovorax sp. RT4R15 TaxID=3443737 RepID=UPI003F477183
MTSSERDNIGAAWLMLAALTTAFALSQAYRTVAAIMAPRLQADFGLTAQALGLFAGAFHFAFGALQLFMGIGIDLYGVRRTVLAAFPLAIAGAVLSALSTNFPVLVAGQVLIGIGCAPAFLVCTVFIARRFPADRFASVSGLTLGIGSVGMLLTGTPLAWLIEASSWRTGFWALALCSVLAWAVIFWRVREPAPTTPPVKVPVLAALRSYGALFGLPHTLGIVALAAVTYAAFITLRGLWLGPLLIERHGFSLVQSGNVAVIVSVVGMFGPPLFGRIDPGPAARRRWIVGFTLIVAVLFGVMAATRAAWLDVGAAIAVGLASGYIVLQYADVKAAYPTHMTGRAMAVLTMAMFLGVAVMQWLTGVVASVAAAHGFNPFSAVLATIAALLLLGATAFAALPTPLPAMQT